MLATTEEMAQRLRCVPKTVLRMLADGRIPLEYATKIGNDWRFNGDAVERHILEMRFEPPVNP